MCDRKQTFLNWKWIKHTSNCYWCYLCYWPFVVQWVNREKKNGFWFWFWFILKFVIYLWIFHWLWNVNKSHRIPFRIMWQIRELSHKIWTIRSLWMQSVRMETIAIRLAIGLLASLAVGPHRKNHHCLIHRKTVNHAVSFSFLFQMHTSTRTLYSIGSFCHTLCVFCCCNCSFANNFASMGLRISKLSLFYIFGLT